MEGLDRNCYFMKLGPFSKTTSIKPGQFVHIRIPDSRVYFRRAFSVYDIDLKNRTLDILFKAIGRGTTLMSGYKKGDVLDVLGPLGNGFRLPGKRETAILAAGGVGMPPLYFLAKHMIHKHYAPERIFFFYGGKTKADLVDLGRIKKLGVKLFLSTDDGSFGFRGFVTEAIRQILEKETRAFRIYGCGPDEMLKAIDNMARRYAISGQYSLEAPMPCGVGVCLGCIRPLAIGGYTRVCREGPVYNIGEVLL